MRGSSSPPRRSGSTSTSPKDDETIKAALVKAGYSEAEAEAEVPQVRKRAAIFHNKDRKQHHARSFMNLSEELVVALRDAAGLAWGGVDISGNENGDFMHFDCRNDSLGRALVAAARKARA